MSDEKKDGPSKSAYHSEIVKRSPVVLTFTTGPHDSKFKDKLPYARFLEADGAERMLLIENAAVRGALESVPLNQPVTVTAEGSRDGATLRWAPAGGAAPAPKPQQAQSKPAAQVPQHDAYGRPQPPAMPPSEMLALSIGAAHEAVTLYRQRYEGTEYVLDANHIQAFATSIFIAACRREVSLSARDDDQGAWLDLGAKLEEACVLGAVNDMEKRRIEDVIASQNSEKITAASDWLTAKINEAKKAAEDARLPFDRAPLAGATA